MEILKICKPCLVTYFGETVFEANLQQLLSQTLPKTANTSD